MGEVVRLEHADVLRILPHRAPMLLVDHMPEVEPGVRGVGIKQVSADDPFFAGHFPGNPIMPGVMVLEAMAQAAGVVALSAYPEIEGIEVYLLKAEQVRWRRMVRPGDTLRLEVTVLRRRGQRVWSFACTASVEGELCGEAELLAMTAPSETG